MKLAIVLLSCLVGLSYQQRYVWPMPFAPRAHLAPLYYADGRPADDYQLEGSLNGVVVDDGAESKLGGGLVAGALANMQPLFTVTSTVTATSTVVAKTPVTSSCLPLSLFASGSSGYTTSACSQRRRRAIEDADAGIEPSLTQLETTDVGSITVTKDAPEIESSHDAQPEQRNFASLAALRLTKTVEVTTFVTTTAISPLVVQKTVQLAVSASLKCLPPGYLLCSEF